MRVISIIIVMLLASAGWFYYNAFMHDEPLIITTSTILQLQTLRQESKFTDLPGENIQAERTRNESNLNELLDRLMAGISANPSKRWVIFQMNSTVENMYLEDTEARERFIDYLVRINHILGIQSTNGAFASKLIFF